MNPNCMLTKNYLFYKVYMKVLQIKIDIIIVHFVGENKAIQVKKKKTLAEKIAEREAKQLAALKRRVPNNYIP